MHLIHIGRAPRYMADSVQSIVECSRRPGLRSADTADYVKHRLQSKFGERCFSYAGPAAWNSLPHSIKLITDTSRFKQLLKSHLFRIAFWHFVSAPGQSVSRALQVRICICICTTQPLAHLKGIVLPSIILTLSCWRILMIFLERFWGTYITTKNWLRFSGNPDHVTLGTYGYACFALSLKM